MYAKVVLPKDYDEDKTWVLDIDGHEDSFEPPMNTNKIIRVRKHPTYHNWYYGWVGIDQIPYNYHRSWLKFVRKPKEND